MSKSRLKKLRFIGNCNVDEASELEASGAAISRGKLGDFAKGRAVRRRFRTTCEMRDSLTRSNSLSFNTLRAAVGSLGSLFEAAGFGIKPGLWRGFD